MRNPVELETIEEEEKRGMNGAQYIAETLSAHGVDHVFLILAILRRGLVEM